MGGKEVGLPQGHRIQWHGLLTSYRVWDELE